MHELQSADVVASKFYSPIIQFDINERHLLSTCFALKQFNMTGQF